jgi:hypothetical protein
MQRKENEITGFAAKRAHKEKENFNLQVKNESAAAYVQFSLIMQFKLEPAHSKEFCYILCMLFRYGIFALCICMHLCAFFFELNSHSYAKKTTTELFLCGRGESFRELCCFMCLCVESRSESQGFSSTFELCKSSYFLICPT